jgi:hypothetical protein
LRINSAQVATFAQPIVGSISSLKSNATTGILQVAGPGAGTTRVMTTPDANFTAARTDAGQTFTGDQEITKNDANPQLKLTRTGTFAGFGTISANQFTSIDVSGQTNASQFYINQSAATSALEVTSTSDLKLGSGNLIIGTSGKGIDFSATAGTGTSELLADYEEGTWTPTISGDGGSAGSVAFTSVGYYTKVGRIANLTGYVIFTNLGSWTGRVRVGGVPFTNVNDRSVGAVFTAFTTITDAFSLASVIGTVSNTQIVFTWSPNNGGGGDNLRFTNLAANSVLTFTISYMA